MVSAIVQRYTTAPDGMGGTDYTWNDHLSIEGVLDQLSADEVLANERLGEVSTHVFILFEIVDIKNSDRFIINDRIYRIKNVDNPMQMDRQLEITLEYTGDAVG